MARVGRVSARSRNALSVAALAVVAAVVVAVGAVLSAEEVASDPAATAEPQPRDGFPPLVLHLGLRQDAEARDLRQAAGLYEAGRREEATRVFARYDSLEAKLGSAFAAWPASVDRVEQLGALYPRSSLVQLHVGLARFWAGTGGAASPWREARDVEPDTPYAVRADDFLHADSFAPGLPTFTPSFEHELDGASLAESFDELERDGTLRGRLLYGIALQRLGRPVSARRAFAEAVRLAPGDVDALVADAVGRYDKNNPAAAFSRLGPLTRRFPRAATVRFHLGLLLLWQKDVEEAERQLERARRLEPGTKIAREAARFLNAIRKAGTD
jgi:tetratricopeptide (TPR) repeat protein